MVTARVTPVKSEPAATQTSASVTIFESFYWLPCQANVEVAIPSFTVGDLLRLTPGAIVQTATPAAKDVPIRINHILLGSGKFEVVGDELAIRITEFV